MCLDQWVNMTVSQLSRWLREKKKNNMGRQMGTIHYEAKLFYTTCKIIQRNQDTKKHPRFKVFKRWKHIFKCIGRFESSTGPSVPWEIWRYLIIWRELKSILPRPFEERVWDNKKNIESCSPPLFKISNFGCQEELTLLWFARYVFDEATLRLKRCFSYFKSHLRGGLHGWLLLVCW